MKINVLIADDDASIRFVVSKSLSRAGFNVRATDNAVTLMKWIKAGEGDVVLSDVHMGQEDIFNFVPELKQARPDLPIIIMSANTSVMTALKSGKFGVFEYIPKPFDLTHLQDVIERAAGSALKKAKVDPPSKIDEIGPMIGKSGAMQPVYRGISDFTSGDVPVFIYGDVGTGKNLTAQLIHSSGKREDTPFIEFDSNLLVESCLNEVADGDLFVDRIDELSTSQQNSLLRLLEKNENRPLAERFRVISTGSTSMQHIQASGKLRSELFSHLRGGQIHLPALADRREDISDLASFFVNLNPELDRKRKFSKPALNLLKTNVWDGNVRDLKNLVSAIPLQYSDVIISDKIIKMALSEHFPLSGAAELRKEMHKAIRSGARDLLRNVLELDTADADTLYSQAIAWIEKPLIEEALQITNGNNVKASELLGIHRNTLRMKIRLYNIG